MAFLRSEDMWRMAVFQKSGKQGGEIQNAITLVLILPDTMTQQQAVATDVLTFCKVTGHL